MDLQPLYDAITLIEHHITILNEDYTQLAVDVAVLKSQMKEIIWFIRMGAAAIAGMIITQFWQIVILRKNNKKN